ncbi:PAS domain-containing protein, partial [Chloroflexota bacterium]
MKRDQTRTKEQLINELERMRSRVAELEAVETEHKRAEQASKESEERCRQLFETSMDGMYISTKDGRFIDGNQSVLDLIGYSKKELLNLNTHDLYFDPRERERILEVVEKDGSVRDYELKLRRKDGTAVDCLVTSSMYLDQRGNVLGSQGIVRDITERRQAEEERRVYIAGI